MTRIKVELPDTFHYGFTMPVLIGDINHGNHFSNDAVLRFVNEGRARFLNEMGLSDFDIGDGISSIASGLVIKYISPAYYGDILKVEVAYVGHRAVEFTLAYRISHTTTGQEVARAVTGLVCVDGKNEKMAKVPEIFIEKIAQHFE
ncbi:MAG: thioesterase [bacterium]|nr:thioesterase [bacterium]